MGPKRAVHKPKSRKGSKRHALARTARERPAIEDPLRRAREGEAEARAQQAATAAILKVIASSPDDVQPVFEAIVENAARLTAPCSCGINMLEGDRIVFRAGAGLGSKPEQVERMRALFPIPHDPNQYLVSRAIAEGRVLHSDPAAAGMPGIGKAVSEVTGARSITQIPLVKSGVGIGTLAVRSDDPGFRLSERQLAVMQTFADQAVIAIENVRLFNETKEALERQTATAEVLKAIASSPSDTRPVFDVIAEQSVTLCGAQESVVLQFDGTLVRLVGQHYLTAEAGEAARKAFPCTLEANSAGVQAIRTGQVVEIQDVQDVPNYQLAGAARASGLRRVLGVPLMRGDQPIGAVGVAHAQPGRFSAHQIAMVQTFADQAVIAIESVRLFNETKEALERQTATSEILRIIARSPTDEQPVFDAIARSAMRLVGGQSCSVTRVVGNHLHIAALTSTDPSADDLVRSFYPMPLQEDTPMVGVVRTAKPLLVRDTETDPVFGGNGRQVARARGFRTIVYVPMLRESAVVGVIHLAKAQPNTITDSHLRLLQTFADQAVIAIENVRLFKELKSRTEALTKSVGQLQALSEVGQAISETLDLEKVLATIVSRAVQLTGLDGGALYEYDEAQQIFLLRTGENVRPEVLELNRSQPIRMGVGFIGQAAATRRPVQVPDLEKTSRSVRGRDVLLGVGFRALLAVPLVREDHVLGALAVVRNKPGEFPPEVIALLETFATQSAIAIQNARLFREIEAKGQQLEVASRHKSDFLASMSHELRTPLNAILGFNEMMLDGLCGEVPEGFQDPLQETQTSGKHLLRLINNVLDLAKIEAGRMELALADYSVQDTVAAVHSTLRALAEAKALAFNVEVSADLPIAHGDAGRLTQCLMNLAGNSIKFTKEGHVAISVQTKGDALVFSVADTGIGIPPEKIGSLFTEFKQTDATIANEYGGTGLGLSITKKFIEMHGGSIWVESEPGRGSTFSFEIPLRAKAR